MTETQVLTQASRLLPFLFEQVDDEQLITVLNVGPALSETVNFFSGYRCKLYFADLYPELPLHTEEENGEDTGPELERRLEEALQLPDEVQFDIVFLWDVLNFMSSDAIDALMDKLRPHLHPKSRAHCFAVHSSQIPIADHYHGIVDEEHLSVRKRPQAPPDYQPHPQGELVSMLNFFQVDRSVLMPDRRVELLLNTRL